jgi:hypothetical protein
MQLSLLDKSPPASGTFHLEGRDKMQLRRLVVSVVSAVILASAACAHPSTSADTSIAPKAAAIQPPKMLRGDMPRLRSPGKFDAKIEVLISANGEPDMTTLQITGSMGGDVRSELRDWIHQSQFEPARQGGLAVPAVFKMGLSLR